jgi:hypothetical protein
VYPELHQLGRSLLKLSISIQLSFSIFGWFWALSHAGCALCRSQATKTNEIVIVRLKVEDAMTSCRPGADRFTPQPGDRVLVLGDKATVRYVGSVAGQEGMWIGLEWDNASRGKHDGSTGGTRYFQTRSPAAGSFVRQEKVNFGCSVGEALEARYSNQRGELGDVGDSELYVHTGACTHTTVTGHIGHEQNSCA